MRYKSISDWAKEKIDSQIRSIGFSNYSQDYLENNYAQVALDQYALLSKACASSHNMSIVQCLNDKGYKAGYEKVLNFGARGEFYPSKIDSKIIENLRYLILEQERYLGSLKAHLEELDNLFRLQNKVKWYATIYL